MDMMATVTVAVYKLAVVFIERHHVHAAMSYTPQCDHHLRKAMNRFCRPAHHHRLQAIVVVQVGVQAGDDQVVVFVLQ